MCHLLGFGIFIGLGGKKKNIKLNLRYFRIVFLKFGTLPIATPLSFKHKI